MSSYNRSSLESLRRGSLRIIPVTERDVTEACCQPSHIGAPARFQDLWPDVKKSVTPWISISEILWSEVAAAAQSSQSVLVCVRLESRGL